MSKLKSLSLKKKPVASGQPTITNFFKNVPANKQTTHIDDQKDNHSNKRKAHSPINPQRQKVISVQTDNTVPLIEILDSPQCSPKRACVSEKESAYFSQEIKTPTKNHTSPCKTIRKSPRLLKQKNLSQQPTFSSNSQGIISQENVCLNNQNEDQATIPNLFKIDLKTPTKPTHTLLEKSPQSCNFKENISKTPSKPTADIQWKNIMNSPKLTLVQGSKKNSPNRSNKVKSRNKTPVKIISPEKQLLISDFTVVTPPKFSKSSLRNCENKKLQTVKVNLLEKYVSNDCKNIPFAEVTTPLELKNVTKPKTAIEEAGVSKKSCSNDCIKVEQKIEKGSNVSNEIEKISMDDIFGCDENIPTEQTVIGFEENSSLRKSCVNKDSNEEVTSCNNASLKETFKGDHILSDSPDLNDEFCSEKYSEGIDTEHSFIKLNTEIPSDKYLNKKSEQDLDKCNVDLIEENSTHKMEKLVISKNNEPIQNNVLLDGSNKSQEKIDSIFEDEWDAESLHEDSDSEDLDLSCFQRCEIVSIEKLSNLMSRVKLKSSNGDRASCLLEGIWNTLPLQLSDVVSVQACKDGVWKVSDRAGLLVVEPDVLVSSTTVVGAVFCMRRAVLQERYRGMDCGNKAMTLGILVHELLQMSLQQRLTAPAQVSREVDRLLATGRSVHLLYDADMSLAEARHEVATFVPQVARFVGEMVFSRKKGNKTAKADNWNGEIEKVLDIEENVVAPKLGLKGKIDVTLQVKIHHNSESEQIPLELKTGRASASAEHRGQLILYMMMMSLFSSRRVSRGLLLYLKDMVTLKEVSSGYPEQRDLIMLRNQLAHYLSTKSYKNIKKSMENKEVDSDCCRYNSKTLGYIDLPEPINHHACEKCPYLNLCSIYQWHTNSLQLGATHNLTRLRSQALGHLTEEEIEYFLHWTGLLLLEDVDRSIKNPLHHIWTSSPHERERRGRCISGLQIADVSASGDRFVHTFVRRPVNHENADTKADTLSAGEYVLVSTHTRAWLAAGPLTHVDADVVCVALERDLSQRNDKATEYCVDLYESQSQLGFNMSSVASLMDNEERANRLRRLIVGCGEAGRDGALPRAVCRLGARLLRPLGLLQQRAVLRALAAENFLLIHGMPGTGKTQTVSVLIQMLVALGKKVLVTAYTHSAVDNVLIRLPQDMKILRLGSSARVSEALSRHCEDNLTKHCTSPEQLRDVYESAEVVGVTCLGAGHSLLGKVQFDLCVVDESSQALQSSVVRALLSARRFVLLGDPEQLPPLVSSHAARKLGMDECLFSRLRSRHPAACVSLSAQYRMNQRLTDLANLFSYEGLLSCATPAVRDAHVSLDKQKLDSVLRSIEWLAECVNPALDRSVLLLDTGCTADPDRTSVDAKRRALATNESEAVAVVAIVKAFFQAGVSREDIGVITPYRDQVGLLKKCLGRLQSSSPSKRRSPRKHEARREANAVEVNTVDQYQGRDKSVIVYSCCKSWGAEKGDFSVRDSEILEDKRRLTVAITRAKHKLILVGDVATLRHYSTFSRLFQCLSQLDAGAGANSHISIADSLHVLKREFGGFL